MAKYSSRSKRCHRERSTSRGGRGTFIACKTGGASRRGFAARVKDIPRIEYERNIHELSDHGDAEHPVTIAESEIYAIQNALPYAVAEAKRREAELRELLGTYVTDVEQGRPYQGYRRGRPYRGKLPTSGNDPKIRKLVKFYLQYMVEPAGDEWKDLELGVSKGLFTADYVYQRDATKDWLEGLPSEVASNWDEVAELEAERLEWQKTVAKERGMPLSKAHTIEVSTPATSSIQDPLLRHQQAGFSDPRASLASSKRRN